MQGRVFRKQRENRFAASSSSLLDGQFLHFCEPLYADSLDKVLALMDALSRFYMRNVNIYFSDL